MPIEYTLLKDKPFPLDTCPVCGHSFMPFMRGQVQRSNRAWYWPFAVRDYCVVICAACKEIVGWETP